MQPVAQCEALSGVHHVVYGDLCRSEPSRSAAFVASGVRFPLDPDDVLEPCAVPDERPDPALDDQRRRYYRATPFGAKVLRAELQRFSDLLRAAEAKRLLGGTR